MEALIWICYEPGRSAALTLMPMHLLALPRSGMKRLCKFLYLSPAERGILIRAVLLLWAVRLVEADDAWAVSILCQRTRGEISMSGIVGMINLDGAPIDRELLRRMVESMTYRGPDAQDIWVNGHVGFGHTMLRTTCESQT